MKKVLVSLMLALALCFGAASPALAASSDFITHDGVLDRYIGNGGDVVIPDDIREINSYAFRDCTTVTSVTLPSGLQTVGDYVFSGCTSLKSVTFPTEGKMVDLWGSMDSRTFWMFLFTSKEVDHVETTEQYDADGYVIFLQEKTYYNETSLPNLEELINCPNKPLLDNIEANKAALSGWVNPGQYVKTQSERITALSNQICSGLTNDYDKAKAVFDWLTANIAYDYEYYYDRKSTVTTEPEQVLDSRLTVCAGYSKLAQALLQAQDIPALYITGDSISYKQRVENGILTYRPSTERHAWNAAFIDGEWMYMDATWGRPGKSNEATGESMDSPGSYNGAWFDPTMPYFSSSHIAKDSFTASPDDTPSQWAQGETWEAICSKLALNDLQGKYRSNITREEFCRLMVNLVEQKTGQSISAYLSSKGLTASAPFNDTNSAEVAAAYTLGIVNGKSADSFDPNGSISRQEAAAMLTRTAKLLGITSGTGVAFADSGEVSPWASESVAFISGVTDPTTGGKVMSGTGSGNFSPWGSYTREQAIITALRLFHCE